MDPVALASRKKALVQELNGYIGLRKSQSAANAEREEMLAGARTEAEMISGLYRERRWHGYAFLSTSPRR